MKNQSFIIYFKSNSLELFDLSNNKRFSQALPKDLIVNFELVDPKKLIDLIRPILLESVSAKSKILILLGENLLFSKSVPHQESDTARRLNEFTQLIPLNQDMLLAKTYTGENQTLFYATSKLLLNQIAAALSTINLGITAILPDFLCFTQDQFDIQKAMDLVKDKTQLGLLNLYQEPDRSKDVPTGQKPSSIQMRLILTIAVLVIIVPVSIFYVTVKLRSPVNPPTKAGYFPSPPAFKRIVLPSPTPSPSPEPFPTI